MRSRFCLVLSLVALLAVPAAANPFFFTGNPDGKIATLARVGSLAGIQTETADDFLLTQSMTHITSATFAGLIPIGVPLSSISQVEIEFYRVFPNDSDASRTRGYTPERPRLSFGVPIAQTDTLIFTAGVTCEMGSGC